MLLLLLPASGGQDGSTQPTGVSIRSSFAEFAAVHVLAEGQDWPRNSGHCGCACGRCGCDRLRRYNVSLLLTADSGLLTDLSRELSRETGIKGSNRACRSLPLQRSPPESLDGQTTNEWRMANGERRMVSQEPVPICGELSKHASRLPRSVGKQDDTILQACHVQSANVVLNY